MKLTSLVRLGGLLALLACGLPAPLAAQQTESRIVGRLVDDSKAALPGVTVTVTSKQTGAVRTVVTDADGSYVVTSLSPGVYTLQFELHQLCDAGAGGRRSASATSGPSTSRSASAGVTEQVTVTAAVADAGHVARPRSA